MMTNPDSEARASLMCYITLSELAAFERTGKWLSTDHLVASARYWVGNNEQGAPWLDRLLISRRAESLAMQLVRSAVPLGDTAEFAAVLFDNRRLLSNTNRSPTIAHVYRLCQNAVSGASWPKAL